MERQKTSFGSKPAERKEVIAIDWSFRKPIMAYDGEIIVKYNSVGDFKKSTSTIVLCEEGIPQSLFAMDRIIKLVHGAVVKRKREQLGWKKTDENDAKIIYMLYEESKEEFRELKQRERELEILRKTIKSYSRYKKIRGGINNMNDSMIREYGVFEDSHTLKKFAEVCEEHEKRLAERIECILTNYFVKETKELIEIKGLSYILIGKLLAYLGDISRLENHNNLKAFAGISPNKGKNKGKDYRYSRKLQSLLLGKRQICDEFILHRVEPYRSVYDKYKERLHKERPDESDGHIDNMARRKIADKFLKYIWKILKNIIDEKREVKE